MKWEPTLQNTFKGCVEWSVPENHQVAITLFKDPRTEAFEDKDWSFIIEDVRKFVVIYNYQNLKINTTYIILNDDLILHKK